MDTPSFYRIRVKGHLGCGWSAWFEGLSIRHEENGETVLYGPIVDQAALHGVLMKIRDLGLTLMAVNRVDRNGDDQADQARHSDKTR